jgi:hypothetical protein
LSSWSIPILCPIICAIVPARRCGSYVFTSTDIPIDLAVQTVSGFEIPASPDANISPLFLNENK